MAQTDAISKSHSLASLVGSRICHDVISPIGAILNGLELLDMAGGVPGPELALISESAKSADARIRFFRIAFGLPGEERLSTAELVRLFDELSKGGRLTLSWEVVNDMPRTEVRLAHLAVLCAQTALPYGGAVAVSQTAGHWSVSLSGVRISREQAAWQALSRGERPEDVTPATVQFALLFDGVRDAGRSLEVSGDETSMTLRF